MSDTAPRWTAGRGWAYAGAVLGGAVSIAANEAHSYVPPAGVSPGWRPQVGAVAFAAFWPVALLLALEILARNRLRPGVGWAMVRLGLVPVAAVAAIVSYRHMAGLLAWYGEERLTAVLGPLAVDGLMVMAAGVLLAREAVPDVPELSGPVDEAVDEPGWRLVTRAHGVSEAAAKKRVERGYGGLSGTEVVDQARAVLANGHRP